MKNQFLFFILLFSFSSCQTNHQFTEKMKEKIQADVHRDDIQGRMHMFFREIDNKNWKDAMSILSQEVDVDMGEGEKKFSAEKFISSWQESIKGFDGSHHQVGNYGIEIKGRTAKLMFVGTAVYFKKDKRKLISKSNYGQYVVHMELPEGDITNWAWNITSFSYKSNFTEK